MAGSVNPPTSDFDDDNPESLVVGANQEAQRDESAGTSRPSRCIDLMEPIAAIRALAETLRSGALDDEKVADQFLTLIIAEADRLAALAKGLDLSGNSRSRGKAIRRHALIEDRNEPHVDNPNAIRRGT